MVIEELYALMQSVGCPVYAFATETVQDCIVYQYIPLLSDGVKEQGRLETTIITQDMEKAYRLLEKLKGALLTVGDERKTNGIYEISHNGGGCLENAETNTIHLKANFTVKSRARKE